MKDIRHTGVLTWINIDKCLGFITPSNDDDSVVTVDFFHFDNNQRDQYKQFKDGQIVSYQLERGHKITSAVELAPIH